MWRWWYSPTNRGSTQHVVPTPVAEDGLLYVVRPEHRPLFALHAGGSGLMDDDKVAWTFEKNKCWISSPLVYRGRLYVPQEEQGSLVCLDLKTGNVVWQNKLSAKGKMQTSPTGADGKIYLLSMSGEVEVLAAGDEFHELGDVETGRLRPVPLDRRRRQREAVRADGGEPVLPGRGNGQG